MYLEDVNTIQSIYTNVEELRNSSKNLEEIEKLVEQVNYWSQAEKDRKWFHF